MMIDRYTKAVLTVIAVALIIIAVRPWFSDSGLLEAVRPDPAQAQDRQRQRPTGAHDDVGNVVNAAAKYEVTVPKTWGKLVGYSNNNLLLEAPDQTMRIVDVEGNAPDYPKVKVFIRWQ